MDFGPTQKDDQRAIIHGCLARSTARLSVFFSIWILVEMEGRNLDRHRWRLEGLNRRVSSLHVWADTQILWRKGERLQRWYVWRFSGEIGAGVNLLSRRFKSRGFEGICWLLGVIGLDWIGLVWTTAWL